jgi:hypothetical protein
MKPIPVRQGSGLHLVLSPCSLSGNINIALSATYGLLRSIADLYYLHAYLHACSTSKSFDTPTQG